MSKLNALAGKAVTYKIGDIELEIKPLTLADLPLVIKLEKPETAGEALGEFIKKTLKDAVPDATDEEINKVAIKYFKELSNAIKEVNGLNA